MPKVWLCETGSNTLVLCHKDSWFSDQRNMTFLRCFGTCVTSVYKRKDVLFWSLHDITANIQGKWCFGWSYVVFILKRCPCTAKSCHSPKRKAINTRECKRWACKSSVHREMNWPLLSLWGLLTLAYNQLHYTSIRCILYPKKFQEVLKRNVVCIGCFRHIRLWLFVTENTL